MALWGCDTISLWRRFGVSIVAGAPGWVESSVWSVWSVWSVLECLGRVLDLS